MSLHSKQGLLSKHRARRLASVLLVATITAAGVGAGWITTDLPSPDRLYEHVTAPSTRIYDRNGQMLYEILDPHQGAHQPVTLREIPKACVDATIATEDASFYTNPGVDGWAIVRALWINLQGGEILAGGSTITQQLARNLLLSAEERREVTVKRKLRESLLAWRLARRYSKDEILTLYLNETYYGNLAYGIEAAAQTMFGKQAKELDLAECALLAGLPQSPATYNPLEDPRAARARQETVLRLMVRHGSISQQEADWAGEETLSFAPAPFPIQAPHFVALVRAELERELGREAIHSKGLEVHTTLDLAAQEAVERIVRYRLERLASRKEGEPPRNVNNAAVVVLDPHSGAILAMVGSPDYFDARIDGAVNGAVVRRQPGSAIKPFTYAAAFDPQAPNPMTAATMMVDVRTAFVTREGAPYVPKNYDRDWHGPVLLRQALASSYNLIATKVLNEIGIERMTTLARGLGITTFDDAQRNGLALTLGGSEVRLVELTAAYAALANGGRRVEPVAISRVETRDGKLIKAWEMTTGEQVIDERVAYLVTDILADNAARMSTFGEGSALYLSRPAAVKTGTSTDWRDNWTVGYTPNLVTGVWVGNADNTPMLNVSGVTGAAPIWHDTMQELLQGQPKYPFVEPAGMVRAEVCADSGLPPTASRPTLKGGGVPASGRRIARCPYTIEELFIEGTVPQATDSWHWLVALDARNGLLAGPECPTDIVVWKPYTLYPAEAQEWVRWIDIPQPPSTPSPLCFGQADLQSMLGSHGDEPVYATGASGNGTRPSSSLVMISPDQGSRYRLSPELPRQSQRISVAARPTDGVHVTRLTLLLDGQPLETLTQPPYRTTWPLTVGVHTFSAVGIDADGVPLRSARVTVHVE